MLIIVFFFFFFVFLFYFAQNKESGQLIQGYFINAYRNLTTAMIEDLKEASRQWALERSRVSGGTAAYPPAFVRHSNSPPAYRQSETHQQRQQGVIDPYPNPVTKAGGYGDPRHYVQPPVHPQQQPQQPQPQLQQSFPQQLPQLSQQYPPHVQTYYYQQNQNASSSHHPRMEPTYPNQAPPHYVEQAYQQGGNRSVAPYSDQTQDRPMTFSGPPRVAPSNIPPQPAGFQASAPIPGYSGAPAQAYYSQAPNPPSYVRQDHIQPQDPFLGRSGAYSTEAAATSPANISDPKSNNNNNVAGKGKSYSSPGPYEEDQSNRTVTPTSGNVQTPPGQARHDHDRERDPRNHQHRTHGYP